MQGYIVTYDNEARTITNIKAYPQEKRELVDIEAQAILPPLESMQSLGLEAIASVKLFMPDGSEIWYPTEYDGTAIFFGLGVGWKVRIGYFLSNKFEEARGIFERPMERDRSFIPKTLRELKAEHER